MLGSFKKEIRIRLALDEAKKYFCVFLIVPTPTLVGREELYIQMGFFLCSQFCAIDIFIVESFEWYH